MGATGIAIAMAVGDARTTTAAGRGITMMMDTTTHAANGDTSRLRHNRFVGWVFSISAILLLFARVRKDALTLDLIRLHQAIEW